MADADDTAKSILSLTLLGRSTVKPESMIQSFDNGLHFRTYVAERNPSFSANCNVLISLLHLQDPGGYVTHIQKAAVFLCDAWFTSTLMDKWVRYRTNCSDYR
jgi:hypothetical protein